MKKTRAKSTGLTNAIDFEVTVNRVSFVQGQIAQIATARDHAVQQLLLESAAQIAELEEELKGKLALCEKFAAEHRKELLVEGKKSADTVLSRWGFRTGNRTVVLASKAWKWPDVLAALKEHGVKECVRTVEEVDKETVLKLTDDQDGFLSYRDEESDGNVQIAVTDLGMRIKQVETFFIEPLVESAEPVKGGAS